MLGYHTGKVWLQNSRATPNGSDIFEPNLSSMIAQHFSNLVRSTHNYLLMKTEQTECSETSAYKLQTSGNYPEESIQHFGTTALLRPVPSALAYPSHTGTQVNVYNDK